jgi:hypothetical protein
MSGPAEGVRRSAAVPPGFVSWRPWLEADVLRQMRGLPPEAFDMLVADETLP